jgi:hypothetical protein
LDIMVAPLGTLAFLVLLWLIVVVSAALLEGNTAKIIAAFAGNSRPRRAIASPGARMRRRAVVAKPLTPRWRAAA